MGKTIYIVKKYRIITCTDFNDQKKEIIENILEKEEELSESNRIGTKIKKYYITKDHVRWYDVATLSISWWFRTKYLFGIYESEIHKIENEIIVGDKKHMEDRWE